MIGRDIRKESNSLLVEPIKLQDNHFKEKPADHSDLPDASSLPSVPSVECVPHAAGHPSIALPESKNMPPRDIQIELTAPKKDSPNQPTATITPNNTASNYQGTFFSAIRRRFLSCAESFAEKACCCITKNKH